MLFFWNFLLRVGNGIERNGMTNFIFSISMRFTTNFGLKWSHNDIFKFSNYFATFLEFSISCRVGTKTEWYLLYSLFLGLYQPILAWNEAIIIFFNILKFFAIFLEFSISCRVGTERNGMTVSFSAFSNQFWLERNPYWYFLIFWTSLLFYWNFLLRVV